jgi:hypothetical protein
LSGCPHIAAIPSAVIPAQAGIHPARRYELDEA